MEGDFVNTGWAREARAAVELAAKDMSAAFPCARGGKCRIAWGYANNEDAGSQERMLLQYRRQFGLLIWAEEQIELKISPDGEGKCPEYVDLRIKFASSSEQELLVPLSPQELYNVLACLDRNVKLRLFPRREPARIFVVGAESSIPFDGLTGRTLYDAITRLHMSRLAVDALGDSGDDWWNMDLEEEPSA